MKEAIMGIKYISNLPSPEEIIDKYPLSKELEAKKKEFDKEIADVITGKSKRILAVIGPCSADNEDSVLDYASRLTKVAEEVKDKIIVIPRVYTNKPRTNGDGYKGLLHQPNPEKKPNVHEGIIFIDSGIYNGADIIVFTVDEHRIVGRVKYLVERNASQKQEGQQYSRNGVEDLFNAQGRPFWHKGMYQRPP